MIEYKPTNKIFPNRKAAKQHFGKQYFNKLWQEDKFITQVSEVKLPDKAL